MMIMSLSKEVTRNLKKTVVYVKNSAKDRAAHLNTKFNKLKDDTLFILHKFSSLMND